MPIEYSVRLLALHASGSGSTPDRSHPTLAPTVASLSPVAFVWKFPGSVLFTFTANANSGALDPRQPQTNRFARFRLPRSSTAYALPLPMGDIFDNYGNLRSLSFT